MNKSCLSLTIVLLVFCVQSVYAQFDFREGYIINLEQDSIIGFVAYQSNRLASRQCFFKSKKNGRKEKFLPNELKAYGFVNNKRFVSKNIGPNSEAIFVQELVKGKLSLLVNQDVFLLEKDSIIELPQPKFSIVATENGRKGHTNNRYKGLLNYYVSDCSLNALKTDYDQRSLTYLIQNYNKCLGANFTVYKEKLPWGKVNISLLTGLELTSFSSKLLEVDFGRSLNPKYGILVDISSPKIFDRLSLNIEANYSEKLFQDFSQDINSPTRTYYDHLLSYKVITTAVGAKYNFRNDYSTPYLKLNVKRLAINSFRWQVIKEQEANNTVVTDVYNIQVERNNPLAFGLTAGYSHLFFGRIMSFAEISVDRFSNVIQLISSGGYNYGASIGIKF